MTPVPYLFFRANAREAFEAYGRIFGATPQIMSFGDMPPGGDTGMGEVPAGAVMHAAVQVGDGWLYGSDDPTGGTAEMAGCNIHVEFATAEETCRVWDALAEGGEVRMPLEASFWAPLFGALSDRFGIRWMVSQAAER